MIQPGMMLYSLDRLYSTMAIYDIIDRKPQTLDITYHPPHVERLFWDIGHHRLSFHCIHHSSNEPLWHPHPWPAAFSILKGNYVHKVGFMPGVKLGDEYDASSCETEPVVISTQHLIQGCSYEMVDPLAFHSVAPGPGRTYTLMLTARPWEDRIVTPKPPKQEPLSDERAMVLQAIALELI